MSAASNPLVSVLVPAFNHAKYIQKCLDSTLSDGYPNLEVVVLDDGSSDETYARAAAWGELRGERLASFRLLQQANCGLTVTLNRLVTEANGEFITMLASDDYLLSGGIRGRLDYLQAYPDLLAVFADCIVVDEVERKLFDSGIRGLHGGNKAALQDDSFRRRELLLRWSVPGPVFLARREGEDLAPTLRLDLSPILP